MTSFSQIVNGDGPKHDVQAAFPGLGYGRARKKGGAQGPPFETRSATRPEGRRCWRTYFKASPLAAPCILISTFSVRPS